MICNKCGTENPDNFKFCQNCGYRLDGKKVCHSCGAEIDGGAKFCGFCGANTEEAPRLVKSEIAVTSAVATPSSFVGWKKVINYVSWGFVAFAALIGLIFTFCIGVTAQAAGVGSTVTIYDYFGKIYDQCKLLTTGNMKTIAEVGVYLPAVMGTVLSAGSLISIIVFFIMTVVASVNRFVHKKDVNWTKPAIGAYVSYAVFATAFLALNAASVETNGVKVGANFSAATLAGLILGGIGLGGYFVCKAVLYFTEVKDVKAIVKSAVMFGAGAVAVAAVSLLALPALGLNIQSGSTSVSTKLGHMEFIGLLNSNKNDVAVLCCSTMGFVVQLLALAFTVLTVISAAKYVSEGSDGKVLPYSIASVILTAVNLALSIASGVLYIDGITSSSEEYTVSFGAPIAIFVLSAVSLVAVIVSVSLFKKNSGVQEEIK